MHQNLFSFIPGTFSLLDKTIQILISPPFKNELCFWECVSMKHWIIGSQSVLELYEYNFTWEKAAFISLQKRLHLSVF